MRKRCGLLLVCLAIIILSGCKSQYNAVYSPEPSIELTAIETQAAEVYNLELPSASNFDGIHPWVAINGNVPYFSEEEQLANTAFENYSELDELGRCGVAFANICKEIMPTEKRGEIGSVKPSGWQTVKYDFVDGKYLYNRCHLIGYQLASENANPQNLITGTRYLNIYGMLPFENMVADYVKETNNHVLYRVTPIFEGDNLVADGVLLEGWSVEDKGADICFNVFCFNAQPGVVINYKTGESKEQNTLQSESEVQREYILNLNSKKFHLPECTGVEKMSENNKDVFVGTKEELISRGYSPCSLCNP